MNKIIKIILTLFILNSCAYEPIFIKKNYDFYLTKIITDGEKKINQTIKDSFLEKTKIDSSKRYEILLESKMIKKIIASNKKGDPTIYKLDIFVEYNIIKNKEIILTNEILKQATYNNIDDKFELLTYEENVIDNLSERFADDILLSIATLAK